MTKSSLYCPFIINPSVYHSDSRLIFPKHCFWFSFVSNIMSLLEKCGLLLKNSVAPYYLIEPFPNSWFKSSLAYSGFRSSSPLEGWPLLQEGLCLLQCCFLGFLLSLPCSHFLKWEAYLPLYYFDTFVDHLKSHILFKISADQLQPQLIFLSLNFYIISL